MPAFLLTWNPEKFDWDHSDIARLVKRSVAGKTSMAHWSCSNSRKLRKGDRAFLIKLGRHGRGIFAAGWMTRDAHNADAAAAFGPMGVDVEWDAFLDPRVASSLLDPSSINTDQHWTPQNSGASIDPVTHSQLELRWAAHLADRDRGTAPRTVSDDELITTFELEALEGEIVTRLIKHRRRERSLRNAKLVAYRRKHGSLQCEVCGYDFRIHFGVDYAEVHHTLPLAAAAGPRETKLSDLAVLCANCHRVAHLNPAHPRSLVELRTMRAKISS